MDRGDGRTGLRERVAFPRLVVFFVACGVATQAIDRLVVDGLRAVLGH